MARIGPQRDHALAAGDGRDERFAQIDLLATGGLAYLLTIVFLRWRG